jgi:predicted O-methyltransferase YrrM
MQTLKQWKWALEAFVARRCFDLICWSFPEMRVVGDLLLPLFPRHDAWWSGLGDARWLLCGAVSVLRTAVVVEIGSARGLSTCTLAMACRQNNVGKVFAIDPNTPNDWSELDTGGDNYDFLRDRVREYGLAPWCELIRSTSEQAARDWSRPIDFLFIDGDHAYDGVKHDFEAFRPWLTDRAVVAFHDSAWEHGRDQKGYRPKWACRATSKS